VLDMLADPSIGYQIECDKAATHGGKSCMPLALIVCPTRELCMQLLYEIRRFTGLRTRMLLTVACTVLQLVTR
jgi:superfamily II DNA/RNA helicase